MGLLSRGSVQSYFYLFEGLGINSHFTVKLYDTWKGYEKTLDGFVVAITNGLLIGQKLLQ